MCCIKMVELRLEYTFLAHRYGMEVKAMDNQIPPLEKPFQAVLLLRGLKGTQMPPTSTTLQSIIHWDRVCVDAIHDCSESILIKFTDIEKSEIEYLANSVPERIQSDVSRLCVFPEGSLRFSDKHRRNLGVFR